MALVVKNLPTNAGDIRNAGSILGSRRFSWRSVWQLTPLFYLENPMDTGAWQATVHRVTKSQTRLRRLSMHKMRHRQKKAERISRTLVSCGATSVPILRHKFLKERREKEATRTIWRNNGLKFSKFDENYKATDSGSSANSKPKKYNWKLYHGT